MKLYNIKNVEDHRLNALAKAAGYASLTEMANNRNMWSLSISEVESDLKSDTEHVQQLLDVGLTWDDLLT
jgi:hypothetical protein